MIHIYIYIYTEGYSESTEPMDAVNSLPLTRFEPTTSATPPINTSDIDATNCATETSPKKDVQVALILTTTNAVHVVYWFLLLKSILFFLLINEELILNILPSLITLQYGVLAATNPSAHVVYGSGIYFVRK